MRRARELFYLSLVFAGGFCSMGLEMTAARVLAPYFGTSNYIWTNVIGVILLALSLGYYIGGRLADRSPSLRTLGYCLLAGGLLGMPIPFVIRPLAEMLLPAGLTLDNAFLLIFKGSLIGALLFAPCVVALGMVSPFVIRLLSDETGHVGESTGKVFAVSTVGSLGGIFLSTLWLVPAIGSRSTVLLFSGVLAAVAIVILAWKRPAMGAALLVFAPLALGNATSIKHVAGSLGEWESGYQYIQVLEEGDTRKLSLNEGLDSFHSILVEGEYLTRGAYYDYYTAFPFLFDGQDRLDVAVLGGGGGTTARQYRHFFADRFNVHVDSVEIDPQVSEVGRRYFDYPTEGVDVFDLDARVFMNLTDATYDIVIVDAYANQVYIPFHVATKEFFERVHDRLGDRGVVAMNVGSFQPATPLVEALVRTVSEVFPNSYAMILPQSRNLLVFGMKGFEGVDPLLDFAMEPELGSIAASVALSSLPVRERFPGLDRARLLVDAHAPVERLTDRMVWSRVREVLR